VVWGGYGEEGDKGGLGLGGRVGEAEGSGRGGYGVLQFVPDDGGDDRFLLQEMQGEVGLGLGSFLLGTRGSSEGAADMCRARASGWGVLVSRFCSSEAGISSRVIRLAILPFFRPKWTLSRFREVVAEGRVRQTKCYRKALNVASG